MIFFEYKARYSKKEALEKLKLLKLNKLFIQNVTDIYLISKNNKTQKIYETKDGIFFITVARSSKGFAMNQEKIDVGRKEKLIQKNGIEKIMKKERKVWKLKKAEITLDKVRGLKGIFIELQSFDKNYLDILLSKLKIKKSDLITIPYNRVSN